MAGMQQGGRCAEVEERQHGSDGGDNRVAHKSATKGLRWSVSGSGGGRRERRGQARATGGERRGERERAL